MSEGCPGTGFFCLGGRECLRWSFSGGKFFLWKTGQGRGQFSQGDSGMSSGDVSRVCSGEVFLGGKS